MQICFFMSSELISPTKDCSRFRETFIAPSACQIWPCCSMMSVQEEVLAMDTAMVMVTAMVTVTAMEKAITTTKTKASGTESCRPIYSTENTDGEENPTVRTEWINLINNLCHHKSTPAYID